MAQRPYEILERIVGEAGLIANAIGRARRWLPGARLGDLGCWRLISWGGRADLHLLSGAATVGGNKCQYQHGYKSPKPSRPP